MMQSFKEGDRVQRRKDSNPWHRHPQERGPGTVTALVNDGSSLRRVDVRFDNGEEVRGTDPAFFELLP